VGHGEFRYAQKRFTSFKSRFHFVPFAVDTHFWNNKKHIKKNADDYILFVGNDKHRDFNCVKSIIQRMPEKTFIVISKNVSLKSLDKLDNVILISGDWKESVLSDSEMRNYFSTASLIILPLYETLQPSGQSVALQAMACKKTVMITKTAGFWEPVVFQDGKHLIFMESNNPDDWVQKINFLITNPEIVNFIGNEAFSLVNTNNHLKRFGSRIMNMINCG
jgi:glycosyltransferase involved in cell wall biosynthesis